MSLHQLFPSEKIKHKQEIYVEVSGAKLFCKVMGEGEPVIVVHGGPGLSQEYLVEMEELAKKYSVIFYDQRGNGKSTGEINNETMNLTTFINDLRAVQSHFGYQKVTVVGHSWGAYLAMSYASQFPDSIARLVVLNSIPIVQLEPPKSDMYEKMIADILKSNAYLENDAAGMIKFYKEVFFYFFSNPDLLGKLKLDQMTAEQVKNSAIIHHLFQRNFFHQPHDLRPELTALKDIPTLIMHGKEHDIPEAVAHEIKLAIPHATLVMLNCGHFPYVEKPQEFYNAISEFCRANPKERLQIRIDVA